MHGTNVQVLGWDVERRQGLEVGNFESTDDRRKMGETLVDEGADIIMPVAGPVGLGTLAVTERRRLDDQKEVQVARTTCLSVMDMGLPCKGFTAQGAPVFEYDVLKLQDRNEAPKKGPRTTFFSLPVFAKLLGKWQQYCMSNKVSYVIISDKLQR